MDPPWIADDEVDVERARALLRRGVPEVAADRVEPLGAGWDNSAFLVDDRWVVRFPRRTSAVELLETELRVLPRLAGRLPLAVPAPAFVGAGSPDHPWPFAGYPLIPGRTACVAAPPPPARRAAGPILGAFLKALHALPHHDLELPGDTLGRLRLDARRSELVERLGVLADRRLIDDPAPWLTAFDAAAPDPPAPRSECLVHGDLYARHLVMDDDHRITGVIDWGDVHRGDPAVDLMVAYAFLPANARAGFFSAYGPVDETTARAARRRALFHSAAVAWYGAESGDPALAAEGCRALDHVLS